MPTYIPGVGLGLNSGSSQAILEKRVASWHAHRPRFRGPLGLKYDYTRWADGNMVDLGSDPQPADEMPTVPTQRLELRDRSLLCDDAHHLWTHAGVDHEIQGR